MAKRITRMCVNRKSIVRPLNGLKALYLRVEPKVTFNKYLGYSKDSSGRSEPSSLYVIRILVNKKSD